MNMENHRKKIAEEMSSLLLVGNRMLQSFNAEFVLGEATGNNDTAVRSHYQDWYSTAGVLIKQLLPERYSEFVELYEGREKKPARGRREVSEPTIKGWLVGVRPRKADGTLHPSRVALVANYLNAQNQIVKAASKKLESVLHDLSFVVRAELFDSELEAASHLLEKGFLRGAGAMGGVVLESHLRTVATTHNVSVTGNKTINKVNTALKSAGVIEQTTWRNIQLLGDIRNLCDHPMPTPPTRKDVAELLKGVSKIIKTVF